MGIAQGLCPAQRASESVGTTGAPTGRRRGGDQSTCGQVTVMDLNTWLIYLLAAIGLSLSPGPNGLLALTHGALHGRRKALYTIFGGAFGFIAVVAFSMLGIGALLKASLVWLTVMKWVGGAYRDAAGGGARRRRAAGRDAARPVARVDAAEPGAAGGAWLPLGGQGAAALMFRWRGGRGGGAPRTKK